MNQPPRSWVVPGQGGFPELLLTSDGDSEAVQASGEAPDAPAAPADAPSGPDEWTDEYGGAAAQEADSSTAPDDPADPQPDSPAGPGAPSLSAACEAILLLVDEPMPAGELAALVRRPVSEVEDALRGLADEYVDQGRGFSLSLVAGGWRFYTSAQCAEVVARYVTDGQAARLSQAAMETLAIIAYRQPISRGRISAVRGVNVDGVVRTLISRGLVVESGTEAGGQSAVLRSTPYLLERLGLSDLSQLPSLADHIPDHSDLADLLDLSDIR